MSTQSRVHGVRSKLASPAAKLSARKNEDTWSRAGCLWAAARVHAKSSAYGCARTLSMALLSMACTSPRSLDSQKPSQRFWDASDGAQTST